MSYLLLCFLPKSVSTSDRVEIKLISRTLGLFHLILDPAIISASDSDNLVARITYSLIFSVMFTILTASPLAHNEL